MRPNNLYIFLILFFVTPFLGFTEKNNTTTAKPLKCYSCNEKLIFDATNYLKKLKKENRDKFISSVKKVDSLSIVVKQKDAAIKDLKKELIKKVIVDTIKKDTLIKKKKSFWKRIGITK